MFILLLSLFCFEANAGKYIDGYVRSNGTYVQGHMRSDSDGIKENNYGYKAPKKREVYNSYYDSMDDSLNKSMDDLLNE